MQLQSLITDRGALLAAGLLSLISSVAHAQTPVPGTVDLLATPPDLTSSVSPNVMVTLDDSGSMGRHYMPDARPYGGGWGLRDDQNNVHNNRYDYANIPWACAAVIDPRVTDPADPRSFAMNGVYYNPNVRYQRPLYADGVTQFPVPVFTNAWNNGIMRNRPNNPLVNDAIVNPNTAGDRGTRNLATARFCTSTTTNNGAGYYRLRDNVVLTVNTLGQISNTGTLYTAANWEWVPLPLADRDNFAIWWSYYHTRALSATSAMTRAFAQFDENVRISWQNLNSNQIAAATSIFKFVDLPINSSVRTRFYDWLFTMQVGGGTPTLTATTRAGNFFTRTGANDRNPYWDRDLNRELSCRQNFHFNITDGFWNQEPPGVASVVPRDTTSHTLPDGRAYTVGQAESTIMWNELGSNTVSLADIAFRYWANNLRPDFADNIATRNKVPPFLPDRSTALFGPPLAAGQSALAHREIYWNPANNPATWSHMVNFMINFGVSGTIPQTENNLRRLRLGQLQWPATSSNTLQNIDDMWHGAINSRGRFFSASNPNELISALQEVIASVLARRGTATAASVSIPLLTSSTTSYAGGFDSSDWSGTLVRNRLDPATAREVGIDWDAGCILTGGFCTTTGGINAGPGLSPNQRRIVTSTGAPGSGRPFRWDALSVAQRARLSVNPTTIRRDLGTWTADTLGELRLNYIRGDRTHETTDVPRFKVRSSLLGAVIRSQPTYVSSPISGHREEWPENSPERDCGRCYEQFQRDKKDRRPVVYVGSNNGMVHAFDGGTGAELMAYIPNTLIDNFRVTRNTQFEGGLVPGVDERALQYDVFLNGSWRTVLVGGMRLGGRGIYALDVTDPPAASSTESSLAAKVMWEFSNGPQFNTVAADDCQPGSRYCSSLGYTYSSVNMVRIRHNDRWVALVSSGYFPTDSLDPASQDLKAGQTSLLVIDLATGRLIREIPTSLAPQAFPASFGLSQAIGYDRDDDQLVDVAVAGDLAGNLWRFDISDENPANWKVDLMFQTYGAGGAAAVGDQPIAFAPTALRDTTLPGRRMFVFGSGKFIGAPDRVSTIPQQSFYGIRDFGTCGAGGSTPACGFYPIRPNQLVNQTLTQDGQGVRSITGTPPNTTTQRGWRIRLAIPSEPGERAGDRAIPLFTANAAILQSIIPKGVDPCDPGATFGIMIVDATTGLPLRVPGDGSNVVGGRITSPRPPVVIETPGGGISVVDPNEEPDPDSPAASVNEAIEAALSSAQSDWSRGSWRGPIEDR